MPLHLQFDHDARLLLVRGTERISYEDLESLVRAIGDAGASRYGKLVDLSKAQIGTNPERLLMAAAYLRAAHAERGIIGPIALLVRGDMPSEILRALTAADRHIRVFASPGQARRWLATSRSRMTVPELA